MAKKKAVAAVVTPAPIEWRWGEPPVDRREIEQAATQWGVLFPEDYILLAQQHHGARPTRKTINIPARSEVVFQSLLSYRTRPRQRDDDMSIFQTWNIEFFQHEDSKHLNPVLQALRPPKGYTSWYVATDQGCSIDKPNGASVWPTTLARLHYVGRFGEYDMDAVRRQLN
jgi:hypothetical protein